MSIYIYPMQFETAVHFGTAEMGGRLEQVAGTLPSDTLFSAMCCELAQHGEMKLLEKLTAKVSAGDIIFSDLLPYQRKAKEIQLYLPKPVLVVERQEEKRQTLQEMRQRSTERKKQKKMEYVRAGNIAKYLISMREGTGFCEPNDFGVAGLSEKVSCRGEEPLPYYVGSFTFYESSGLYLLVSYREDSDEEWFAKTLVVMGLSGIGGKRSSGYGKYHLAGQGLLSGQAGKDAAALEYMLAQDGMPWQMSISSVLPCEEDLGTVKQSQYKLRKRSGFVTSLEGEHEKKKDSIYILSAGSCMIGRIRGRVVSLGTSNGHEILRAGKGLYVGLAL